MRKGIAATTNSRLKGQKQELLYALCTYWYYNLSLRTYHWKIICLSKMTFEQLQKECEDIIK